MDNNNEITGILRAARALLQISQDDLARLAGVSRATISRIENNEEGVALKQIDRVRTALERAGAHFFDSSEKYGPHVGTIRPEPRDR